MVASGRAPAGVAPVDHRGSRRRAAPADVAGVQVVVLQRVGHRRGVELGAPGVEAGQHALQAPGPRSRVSPPTSTGSPPSSASSPRASSGRVAGDTSATPAPRTASRASASSSCAAAYSRTTDSQARQDSGGDSASRSIGPASRVSDQPRSVETASTSGTRAGTRSREQPQQRRLVPRPGTVDLEPDGTGRRAEADRAGPGPRVRLRPLAGEPDPAGLEPLLHPGADLVVERGTAPRPGWSVTVRLAEWLGQLLGHGHPEVGAAARRCSTCRAATRSTRS